MGFSITSAVFGGIIIICYSIAIAMYRYRYDAYWYVYNDNDYSGTASWRTESPTEDYWNRWTTNGPTWGWWGTTPRQYITRYGRDHRYNTEMALSAFILIFGIVEFATGIWAAVCLCLMNPCTCCYNSSPPQQVSSLATESSAVKKWRNLLQELLKGYNKIPKYVHRLQSYAHKKLAFLC